MKNLSNGFEWIWAFQGGGWIAAQREKNHSKISKKKKIRIPIIWNRSFLDLLWILQKETFDSEWQSNFGSPFHLEKERKLKTEMGLGKQNIDYFITGFMTWALKKNLK